MKVASLTPPPSGPYPPHSPFFFQFVRCDFYKQSPDRPGSVRNLYFLVLLKNAESIIQAMK